MRALSINEITRGNDPMKSMGVGSYEKETFKKKFLDDIIRFMAVERGVLYSVETYRDVPLYIWRGFQLVSKGKIDSVAYKYNSQSGIIGISNISGSGGFHLYSVVKTDEPITYLYDVYDSLDDFVSSTFSRTMEEASNRAGY